MWFLMSRNYVAQIFVTNFWSRDLVNFYLFIFFLSAPQGLHKGARSMIILGKQLLFGTTASALQHRQACGKGGRENTILPRIRQGRPCVSVSSGPRHDAAVPLALPQLCQKQSLPCIPLCHFCLRFDLYSPSATVQEGLSLVWAASPLEGGASIVIPGNFEDLVSYTA